eukprot:CAMPEP_0180570598 /NCGR_PEP_ID=MMETSP1037_2-20121125/8284_1 /TAXON_ID=632150 /ORGANISM="Azadinium spinosum, Strain 3D9" /LENGTH=312 /DNA_ID=CAMNT_0022587885 /DNA_START=1229 /DNA_END=2162 /DNA_ORIENTATION=+
MTLSTSPHHRVVPWSRCATGYAHPNRYRADQPVHMGSPSAASAQSEDGRAGRLPTSRPGSPPVVLAVVAALQVAAPPPPPPSLSTLSGGGLSTLSGGGPSTLSGDGLSTFSGGGCCQCAVPSANSSPVPRSGEVPGDGVAALASSRGGAARRAATSSDFSVAPGGSTTPDSLSRRFNSFTDNAKRSFWSSLASADVCCAVAPAAFSGVIAAATAGGTSVEAGATGAGISEAIGAAGAGTSSPLGRAASEKLPGVCLRRPRSSHCFNEDPGPDHAGAGAGAGAAVAGAGTDVAASDAVSGASASGAGAGAGAG